MTYQDYLHTSHWRSLRYQVLKRDGFKCIRCNAKSALQAHHKVYRKSWFDTVPEDCITLCDRCHDIEHGFQFRKKSEVDTDIMIMLIKYEGFVAQGRRVALRFRKQLMEALPMCPPDIQLRINAVLVGDKQNMEFARALRSEC